MKKIAFVLAFLVLLVGVWKVASSSRLHSWWEDRQKAKLPQAEVANLNTTFNVNIVANTNTAVNTNSVTPLPAEKNLAVPFTSQAPKGVWDADHEEFCEESAVAMAGRFFQGKKFTSTDDADDALFALKDWEIDHLGFFFDTTAAETAQMAEGIYGVKVTLKVNPTVTDIKRAIADGHVVIVPAAGRELGNPNFTAPGPIYHNLVVRGYTKDGKFITNDPGTRKGEAYVYDQDIVMSAMHDWVPNGARTTAANGTADGRKVVLIVSAT